MERFSDLDKPYVPDDVMMGINIRNTKYHFVDLILDDRKTIETRTHLALDILRKNGLKDGMRIAIISDSEIKGYATVKNTWKYETEEDFYADYDKHWVCKDSEFAWDNRKKSAIELTDVEKLEDPIPIAKQIGNKGFRTYEEIRKFR